METVKDDCGFGDCHRCQRLYGGICDELKQEEAYQYGEPEDYSDEDDGFADEPEEVEIKVTDDLRGISIKPLTQFGIKMYVQATLRGQAHAAQTVMPDRGWIVGSGSERECQNQIEGIMEQLFTKGYIAIPQAGCIKVVTVQNVHSIQFVLEDK